MAADQNYTQPTKESKLEEPNTKDIHHKDAQGPQEIVAPYSE